MSAPKHKSGLTMLQWFLLLVAFFLGIAAVRTINQATLFRDLPPQGVPPQNTQTPPPE